MIDAADEPWTVCASMTTSDGAIASITRRLSDRARMPIVSISACSSVRAGAGLPMNRSYCRASVWIATTF
jgi:hypothetical protein